MKKNLLLFISLVLSTSAFAEKVAVKANDCGPLARGEFGVVFSTLNNGKYQTYFSKGKAHILCPKIMNSSSITGYESGFCENNKPDNPNECFTIKEFTILSYQNE